MHSFFAKILVMASAFKRLIRRFTTRAIGFLIAALYRGWSSSWQRDEEEIARLDLLLKSDNKVILACWHGKFLPLFALLEGYETKVFTADSPRGEVISKICHRFGYDPSLIPQGGRGASYRHIHRGLQTAQMGAFAVDGPLGPNKVTKPGIVKMASSLGYLIVPISMASNASRVMNSRWDKREMPRFGAKVTLAVGAPIQVPPGLRARELDEWCEKVTAAINSTDARAQARINETNAWPFANPDHLTKSP